MTWYEADSGRAIADFARPPKTGEAVSGNVTRTMVYRIADNGAIQDSFDLALQTGSNSLSEQAGFALMALSLPAPVVLLAGELLMAMGDRAPDDARALGASLAAALAISSVLAAVAWRRGRVFGLSRREQAVWVVFVLLFGVPAFASFLLHRRWPVREPCPQCHSRCARDRDTCAECGTPFPDPAVKGTEIFA